MSAQPGDATGMWLGDEQRALAAWQEYCAAREARRCDVIGSRTA